MCDCNGVVYTEIPFLVCGTCGRHISVCLMNNDRVSGFEDVFTCIYSRKKRFETIINNVLLPCFEKKDSQMYEYLRSKRYETVECMRKQMKQSGCVDKRYGSVHFFARHFVKGYTCTSSSVYRLKQMLLKFFDETLTRYNLLTPEANFFSYPWLLRYFLSLLGVTCYNEYIKEIKCKKRRLKYVMNIRQLFAGCPIGYTIVEFLDNQ